MMRSPPPPPPLPQQQQFGYGNPYQPQQQHMPAAASSVSGAQIYPPYGGFLNDPTAQMGLQMGKTAVMAGQDYVEQNVRMCICARGEILRLSLFTASLPCASTAGKQASQ
jgi:hypothetical protein